MSAEIVAKKKKEQEPKGLGSVGVSNWWGGNKPQDPGLEFFQLINLKYGKNLVFRT